MIRLVFALVGCMLLSAAQVFAAFLPAAGAPLDKATSYPSPTESWFVMPTIGGKDFVLVHVPPQKDSAERTSPQGIYRSVTRLAEMPEALAAWDNAVFAVFPTRVESDGPQSGKTVRSLRTERFGDSELWVDQPSGRMETLPSVPLGKLLGFAASSWGLVALGTTDSGTDLQLLVLADRSWKEAQLPADWPKAWENSDTSRPRLVADQRGIYLVRPSATGLQVWTGVVGEPIGADVAIAWRHETIPGTLGPGVFIRVNGRFFNAALTPEKAVVIQEFTPTATRELATVSDMEAMQAIVPVNGLERLMVVSVPRQTASVRKSETPPRTVRVVELSLLTGRVFYDGPAEPLDPLGSGEFRLISIALILAMGLILVLVLRSEDATAIHLPEGCSFAEPGRRIAATVLDFTIAALLVPRLTGNSVLELFGPMVWLDGEAFETLLLIALLACLIGALGETFFGRSPGKLLTDCEVVSVAKPPDAASTQELPRPNFGASLTRNAIKWFLSPVAAIALMDGSGRHRGDQFAKAAVVIRREEDEEPQADDEF
ncbi:MAG: hypothetical protein U0570_15740 [Phycisphaerales bacterium]